MPQKAIMASGKDLDSPPRPRNGAGSGKSGGGYARPRGGPARPIADLMPEIGRAAFRRFGFVQSSVVTRWPEIVGKRYADVCLPESIRFPAGRREGGTLNLLVSGAHATTLQHIVPEIIERVNRFFGYGAVSQIKFRQGEIAARREQLDHRKGAPPSLRPVPIVLGEGLRDIGDPELERVLQSLADAVARSESEKSADYASKRSKG
jgi:hypothetical protein